MPQVSLESLGKSYGGVEVLHDIDLDIDKGEFVVLVGPSGCGKTTLLKMLAGLESITSGTLRIGGEVVNERKARERDIAMVFQSYALYPHMTVRSNMGFPLRIRGRKEDEAARQVADTAAFVGLDGLLDRKPKQLSGGQRQRVAMGRAIVREPKLFLFDEPLSNLDAKLRVQIRMQIRQLHRELGTTSVYVTHDQTEAMTLADRIVLLKAGWMQQVGTPWELYAAPANTFVAAFIGSPEMNLVEGHVRMRDGRPHFEVCEELALPLPPRYDLREGQAVTLGFRPEHVRLDQAGPIRANVFDLEFLGSDFIAYLEAGPVTLSAKAAGNSEGFPKECRLTVDDEHLHLFDEAGQRIPSRAEGA